MFKKFTHWLRSRGGQNTLGVVVILALVLALLGQQFGWFAGLGAAGVPAPTYPAPTGGYTCLPSPVCDQEDGKFLIISSTGNATFAGAKIVAWIAVPGDYTAFELGIFDGDTGKDNAGALNYTKGNWDEKNPESTYTLYADPLKDGKGATVVNTWRGNTDPMPNNAWFTAKVNTSPEAKTPSGHYAYRLEVTQDPTIYGANAFKLRSNAYLSTGKSDLTNAKLSIVGQLATQADISIIYPQYSGNIMEPGTSIYAGDWQFYFNVPTSKDGLEVWDGDFDRGTMPDKSQDTDDPNTDASLPPWSETGTVPERAGLMGNPADDNFLPIYRREPPVTYSLIDPTGVPIYKNEEPSGTEEWERFVMATEQGAKISSELANADVMVDSIKPGLYILHIQGLDLHNLVTFFINYEVCDPEDGCGPPVYEGGGCALPASYWRQNFAKVYKNEKGGKKAQEDKESLEWALRNVALMSPIFRDGINTGAPAAITTLTPLKPLVALDILTGKGSNKAMARALKHNLAAWLDMGSSKLTPDTPAYLDVTGGPFAGTAWEALKEAETLILNGGDLKRAAELAEFLTYGGTYEEPPKAPKPAAPSTFKPSAPLDPATCGARLNTYGVENPTNNPFYGVKFEYKSGTEVKNGDYDEFKVVLPATVAATMTSVQMEAKAGQNTGQVTLEGCNFAGGLPCGEPLKDSTGSFTFYFVGATDNGDGTLTLTFNVQNLTDKGLSHVTIGLPAGVTPLSPTGSYESKVCPPKP